MRKLIEIIGDSKVLALEGNGNISIKELKIDSRKVEVGDVYIALPGLQVDGHDFIDLAISNGAVAILCEQLPEKINEGVCYIKVECSRSEVGLFANRYYDNPSASLKLTGVTGTNGKTTVATLLWQLFKGLGYKVGLVSTVENKIGDNVIPSTHTTPDAVSLHGLLSEMVDCGCEYAFMEVSSHAVHQQRISGVTFAGGVFTNMSHDHLDYHGTMAEYIKAKKKFFDDLSTTAFALVNIDDKRGEVMLQNTEAKKVKYGLQKMANYKGKIISNAIEGLALKINEVEAHFRMVGKFNAYNLLAAYGVATELGYECEEVLTLLTTLTGAEGRFETVTVKGTSQVGIVDYAHTPDALENVLETINAVKNKNSKVFTVIGCGGDRDKTKRPKMANVAMMLSSKVILTNDNPRTEDAEEILNQMEQGIEAAEKKNVLRISDRKQAIKTAVMLADGNDIILIAGKGHEKYQDIDGIKYPFDDKKVLTAAMQESA